MVRRHIYIYLILLTLYSCKKETITTVEDQSTTQSQTEDEPPCPITVITNNSNDTVFPSEYLMMYPGSYWDYSDGSSDSCFAWEPVQIITNSVFGNCITAYEDTKFLPNSTLGIISNESIVIQNGGYHETTLTRIISPFVGVINKYIEYFGSVYNQTSGHYTYTNTLVEKLPEMMVNGKTYKDVLHVERKSEIYYDYNFGGPYSSIHYYFAKNVGIIRKEYYDTFILWSVRDLVNYQIGPH